MSKIPKTSARLCSDLMKSMEKQIALNFELVLARL